MKNLVYWAKIALPIAILVFSGCGDVGLLLPVEDSEPEVRISTFSKGAILLPDDTFDVSIDYDSEEFFPDRMIIDLRDVAGEILFTVELDEEGIYELPLPVTLPEDLEVGAYSVGVTVFQAEEEIAASESFFFYVSDEYSIRAITAYPQIFYPGGRGLVIADLDIPEGSNPYLRWSSDDTQIYSGTLQEGADKLQLEVPEREGIYTIQLEVFPFGPGEVPLLVQDEELELEEDGSFDFASIISLEAQFFVSTTQDADEEELGPDEDYYSLFHFRGESVDWGYNGNGSIAAPLGVPILDITRDVFGFRLDGSNGFMIEDIILPVEDGYVQPFSFSARFVIDQLAGSVTSITDGNGDLVFSMVFSQGVLTASLLDSSSTIEPAIDEGAGSDLTLTLLPDPETVRYLWFLDGVLIADDFLPYTSRRIAPGGLTLIGGDEGMAGILDELGIYYRLTDEGSAVDLSVFEKAMERVYGNDLVFAEGFDGNTLPDTVQLIGDDESISLERGSLFLPAGTGIGVSSLPSEFESLVVQVAVADKSADGAAETDEGVDEAPVPPVTFLLYEPAKELPLIEIADSLESIDQDGFLTLSMKRTEDSFIAIHDEDIYPLEIGKEGMKLVIENRGENGELEIKSVLIFKNRIQS